MTHDESARDYYEENQKLKAENAKLRRAAMSLLGYYCNHKDCTQCVGYKAKGSQDCAKLYFDYVIRMVSKYD